MNQREKRIWDAAYAQAFVAEFTRMFAAGGVDRAMASTFAELPANVADLAVIRLREWQKTEDVNVGTHVQEKWPEEYDIDPEGLIGISWPADEK